MAKFQVLGASLSNFLDRIQMRATQKKNCDVKRFHQKLERCLSLLVNFGKKNSRSNVRSPAYKYSAITVLTTILRRKLISLVKLQ